MIEMLQEALTVAVDREDRLNQSVKVDDNEINIPNLIQWIESWSVRYKKGSIDLRSVDLASYDFGIDDLFDFAMHMKKVENADLSYPVIVHQKWYILDGRHRLVKAIMEWKKKLDCIFLLQKI